MTLLRINYFIRLWYENRRYFNFQNNGTFNCAMLMRKMALLLLLLIIILPFSGFSQQPVASRVTVQGTVISQDSAKPLAGVTVVQKGTQIRTMTNSKGAYSLTVSGDGVLVFSFIGYAPREVAVGNRSAIDVSITPDFQQLDDVVVVGYGTQSARNVTGAIAKIDMKKTENLPNTNVGQALRGRVAGVQFLDDGRPGQEGSILIRGQRSLSANNSPLIVLDGIIFEGSITDINPNDITSMEVLKDASASAIYGSKAANGVILITSKKGATAKPTIRANAFHGLSDWSYKVKLLSPERFIQSTLDWRAGMGLEADPAKITDYLEFGQAENYTNGIYTKAWDLVKQTGKISSADVSVSAKSRSSSYYISTSLADERGLIKGDNQKRLSFRANLETYITDWLTVGMNSTFSRRDLSGKEQDLFREYNRSPYAGSVLYEDNEYTGILEQNEQASNNLFATVYGIVEVPFLKGLSYRINYSPNIRWTNNFNFQRLGAGWTDVNSSADKTTSENLKWVVENILTYRKDIGDHSFDLTLLYGGNRDKFQTTRVEASRLTSDLLAWNNLGLGIEFQGTSSARLVTGTSSMLRANYRFKGKYMLTYTVRRDGSSVFAANNKYATLPSGSLAWIISEEPFLADSKAVDMLKLRVSYGTVGNQAINPYQSLGRLSTTRYVYGDGGSSFIGLYLGNLPNSDLKWEKTTTTNIGLDFTLFKNLVNGSVELYDMATRDLLVQRSIPTMTGFANTWTNLGEVNNRGFELTLNATPIKTNKFQWNVGFVFSTNKNKIVHLYESDTNGDGVEDDDIGNGWFIGKPINSYFDYVFDGIYQEGDDMPAGYSPGWIRMKDVNSDKVIDEQDRAIVGQGDPKFRYGLTNEFRYGNFSLSFFINAMQGWISEFDLFFPNAIDRDWNHLDFDWWTPENKSNKHQSLTYQNSLGHHWYLSRDFIRLQDVAFAYELPKPVLKKINLSNLRIFLSGKNLYTITNWLGADPENGHSDRTDIFPRARSITLGLNVGL